MQEHHAPIRCGFVGGFLVGVIGVLLPPTMFWGEYEINTLADQGRPLPHIWPKGGIYGLEVFWGSDYPWWLCLTICFTKLLAISITVLSGQLKTPMHCDCNKVARMIPARMIWYLFGRRFLVA